MPLNWAAPEPPLPSPLPVPVLGAASDDPVPVPRDGAVLRTGRVVAPLSSNVGLARVLFWSVGGATSTGGSSVDATFCASALLVLKARMVLARRIARCRFAAVVAED